MAKVTMPQLGESVAEGTIGKWLKQPGDHVDKYEPLLEVITDKVNAEVPSPFEGILKEILVQEGETVPNNAEIAIIEEAGGCRAGRNGRERGRDGRISRAREACRVSTNRARAGAEGRCCGDGAGRTRPRGRPRRPPHRRRPPRRQPRTSPTARPDPTSAPRTRCPATAMPA